MSDQLATDIRDIVDNGAPPITLAELELASVTGMPPHVRRRWPVLAVAAAFVVVVGGVVVAVAHDPASNVAVQGDPSSVPASSTPSGPRPNLLTSWGQHYVGFVYIYDDGQVIWRPDGAPKDTVAWQRRLTPAGLDLVRSGRVAGSELVAGNVPSSAWADPEKIAWTPSEYAACLWQGTATSSGPFLDTTGTVFAQLPARARALLHRPPTTERIAVADNPDNPDPLPPGTSTCFRLTPQEAHAARDLTGALVTATTDTPAIGVMVFPVLPHGDVLVWGG